MGWWMSFFRLLLLFTFIIVAPAPTKRLTWNMLQFFINYYFIHLLTCYYCCEHPFTLDHWYVYLFCLGLCYVVIFVCPLRAVHRNYNVFFPPSFAVVVKYKKNFHFSSVNGSKDSRKHGWNKREKRGAMKTSPMESKDEQMIEQKSWINEWINVVVVVCNTYFVRQLFVCTQ